MTAAVAGAGGAAPTGSALAGGTLRSTVAGVDALLWDVDGTLAETERDGHLVAFNLAFADEGLPWRWDDSRYARLLAVSGGRERLLHDMADRADAPRAVGERDRLARRLHARKNAHYADLVAAGAIPLRAGVRELIDACGARGVAMAITTTTSRASVEALLRLHLGERWAERFAAVVCAEDVTQKKPDPEVFVTALRRLGVEARGAVAIEDSPNGVAAARAAGCPVVVTRSRFFADAFADEAAASGVIAVGPGLGSRAGWSPAVMAKRGPVPSLQPRTTPVDLDDIADWLARWRPGPLSQVGDSITG
ncbi:MAG: HAD-IA family hydrolase [Burkholderiaceae bacterium]